MRWPIIARGRTTRPAGRRPAPAWAEAGRRVDAERASLLGLLLAVLLIAAAIWLFGATNVPISILLLPIMVSALTLSLRGVAVLMLAVSLTAVLEVTHLGYSTARVVALVVIATGGALAGWVASARQRVGGLGLRGESMLLDLRDTLRDLGRLPALPVGWEHEMVLESAGGSSFGGDFVVSTLSPDGKTLEIAVVDVSGKGLDAGTRALLCSGALSALLGAVPPDQFLSAANTYLLRQEWDEGFATAVHVVIELATGAYTVESAGHPPAVQFMAGSGRWEVAAVEGTALGLVAEVSYDRLAGTLGVGDALMLYTDGVVEVSGRDLTLGIDKLVGEAERLIGRGFVGGAQRLLTAMRSGASDDRAMLLLWRA
ncbi:PP2C family protein-serine/threonine phosphatase [Acidothermaceae bacterium B102]|nr:PP2C family protein-serine/threonine phosphatase [Acidothermaceae bacterium B102]